VFIGASEFSGGVQSDDDTTVLVVKRIPG